MMKILMFFMFFMFINMLNKYIMQMIIQNYMFLIFLYITLNFPLNNLNYWMKIYYLVGLDYYSFGLIILSIWIMSLVIMMSEKNLYDLSYKYYFFVLILMLIFLLMCFSMMNCMMFYLFFEASLLPIFLLIMGWGYQIDRIQAGYYMMLYTLFGSLPLLIMIYLIFLIEDSLMMNFIELKLESLMIYILMIMAFLIKMPMYFVHLWLPKAHVEAPLVGSMILAGLMLKLGSYGLMRFMMIMFKLCMKFNKLVILISLIGGIYSSLICLYQVDMKMLVAYSSVVHMSMLMSGMMTLMNWGINGSFSMMIAHGLCSSSMFCLVNINYIRVKSRSLLINKGMINYFPSMTLMWFLICSSNLSFPPSLNLFSEIMLLNSLILWDFNLSFMLGLMMFFSASYTLYLYSYTQHGGVYNSIIEIKSVMILEYMVLILHWIPLNLVFIVIYLYT